MLDKYHCILRMKYTAGKWRLLGVGRTVLSRSPADLNGIRNTDSCRLLRLHMIPLPSRKAMAEESVDNEL